MRETSVRFDYTNIHSITVLRSGKVHHGGDGIRYFGRRLLRVPWRMLSLCRSPRAYCRRKTSRKSSTDSLDEVMGGGGYRASMHEHTHVPGRVRHSVADWGRGCYGCALPAVN